MLAETNETINSAISENPNFICTQHKFVGQINHCK